MENIKVTVNVLTGWYAGSLRLSYESALELWERGYLCDVEMYSAHTQASRWVALRVN